MTSTITLTPLPGSLLDLVNAQENVKKLVTSGLINPKDVEATVKTLRQSKLLNLVTGSIEEPLRTNLIRFFEQLLALGQ